MHVKRNRCPCVRKKLHGLLSIVLNFTITICLIFRKREINLYRQQLILITRAGNNITTLQYVQLAINFINVIDYYNRMGQDSHNYNSIRYYYAYYALSPIPQILLHHVYFSLLKINKITS
jgi:hypothetical protein